MLSATESVLPLSRKLPTRRLYNAMSEDFPDARRHAPATARNREPILQVLKRVFAPARTVLEIASGTGEHATFFAANLPHCTWLPSEPDPESRASVLAWQATTPAPNLLPPLALDVCAASWPVEAEGFVLPNGEISAIACINMIHISPWAACQGLCAGAGRLLPAGGLLYLYGPFKQNGQHTAPSNASFDASLQERDPRWGVRDLEAVVELARSHQLDLVETVEMPANNLSVIFQHR